MVVGLLDLRESRQPDLRAYSRYGTQAEAISRKATHWGLLTTITENSGFTHRTLLLSSASQPGAAAP